jgi:hypothetical protein
MDKLAAALAGYGSHLPDSITSTHLAGLDPDLEVEVARQAARDSNSSSGNAMRQAWRGLGYVRVDGSHDSAERHAAVKKFKMDPSCRVALLSITAAAVGKHLPWGPGRGCDIVSWAPALEHAMWCWLQAA